MKLPPSLCRQFADALVDKNNFSNEEFGKAAYCLLDFLACTLSTRHFAWVQQAGRVACSNSETAAGGAPLIGTPFRVSPQDAAFVNAVAGHSLVRDDMHLGSVSHLGVAVLPTALAIAEQEKTTGEELLAAIICGYEAGAKLGSLLMDVETAKTFRPTGLIGAFAAAAAAARLARLDANKTANALGFATNFITGLNEWAAWGSDDMYFHPGIAARNGITAMQLAREGASAADGSLDGKAGLFAAFKKTPPSSGLVPFCDKSEILQVFFKQVPACNYAQTAAQAALKLRQDKGLTPAAIKQVSVKVPYAAANYPGCDYPGPFHSILQARMSIHFNVASALVNGDFNDRHYQDFSNSEIQELIGKTSIAVDDKLTANYPAMQGACIELITREGKQYTSTLDDVIPASRGEVVERFDEAACLQLGQNQAESLKEKVFNLQAARSLDDFFPLLAQEQ